MQGIEETDSQAAGRRCYLACIQWRSGREGRACIQCGFGELPTSLYYSFGQVFAEFHSSFVENVVRLAVGASYVEWRKEMDL